MCSISGTSLARNLPNEPSFSRKHHGSIEPWPFCRPLMRHRSTRRLTNQPRVLRECPGAMTWRAGRPIAPAGCEFFLIDQQVHLVAGRVDSDLVAVTNERQRTANKRFRRHIADAHAARCA